MSAASLAEPLTFQPLVEHLDVQMFALPFEKRSSLCDALLEMRMALSGKSFSPEAAANLLDVFLRNRRLLARYDYLWTHRLRRRLERSFQLRIEVEDDSQIVPLNLAWSHLEKLLNQARRDYFEHSSADWNDIQVTLEPQF